MQVQKYKNFLIPPKDFLANFGFPLAKFAKSQRLFHVSREFTRIFWNELWLLAIGVWQNKTASAESQKLKANCQSKKKKDTCRYVRFVEPLSRALQFILSVCDLCESPLNLTIGIFPLTDTGSIAN